MRFVFVSLGFVLLANFFSNSLTFGDIIITSRDSQLSVVGNFGSIASTIDINHVSSETSTDSNFGITINGNDYSSGDLGDIGWTSGYTYGNDQNIDVKNNSIQVSSSLSLSAGHDEQGVAKLSADNRVTLIFQNTSASLFKLEAHPINGNGTYRLEAFDGSQWSDIYNGLAGPINLQFFMNPGTFRITASTYWNDVENFAVGDSFNVNLTAVPEPGAIVVLSIASVAACFYRRTIKADH
jgi:hypothetical protein